MTKRIFEVLLFAALLLTVSGRDPVPDTKPEISARGVDVSSYQGKIDWQTAGNHVSFAILRCGVNSGSGFEADPYFEENYAGASDAGLSVGCYLYTAAADTAQMCADVKNALGLLNSRPLDMPVFLDIEDAEQKKVRPSTLTEIISEGCRMIAEEGYTAGVYSNYAFLHRHLHLESIAENGYSIWMARYPLLDRAADPSDYNFGSEYRFWQYSDKGQIPGIAVPVDMDVMYDLQEVE